MYTAALTAFANSNNVQMYIETYIGYTVAWGTLASRP
jgi:hypothetical protein